MMPIEPDSGVEWDELSWMQDTTGWCWCCGHWCV